MKRSLDRWPAAWSKSFRSWSARDWRPPRMPTFLLPFGLAGALFLSSAFWFRPPAQQAGEIPLASPTRPVATVTLPTPSPTPLPTATIAIRVSPTATLAPSTLPTRDPSQVAFSMNPSPSPTPRPVRKSTPTPRPGCDPAYPDERTCIPPGPPFNQGCAITNERRFTVLRPDPQHLDADKDGIGCEPIGGKP